MSSQGVSGSSFDVNDMFNFFAVDYPDYEKRVNSGSSSSTPLSCITVHFHNLPDDEKATGILKNVSCAYSRICGKSEDENWQNTNIDIRDGLNGFYWDKFGGSLQQVNSLWVEVTKLKNQIQELNGLIEQKNHDAVNDFFSMNYSFFTFSSKASLYIPFSEKRVSSFFSPKGSLTGIYVHVNNLSDKEKLTGTVKYVPVREAIKGSSDDRQILEDLNIKVRLAAFERAKNPAYLAEDVHALQTQIDGLEAELQPKAEELQKAFA